MTNDDKTKRVQELLNAHLNYNDEDFYKFRVDLAEFATYLRKKYGTNEVQQYTLFHIMVGSTLLDEPLPRFDFDGDDSVVLFLERATAGK